jgi:multidrug efflux pump subunit AcrA (membrane-fusion protein)
VAYDETRIARVHPKVPGWIEEVYVDFTGKPVNRGEPLVTLYSPELLATQNELLIARNAGETLGPSLYQATRERLRLWDIDDEQIRHLEDRGVPLRTLTLKAPAGGVVTARNAFPGQRVEPGTELYAIADLSRVWVIAELYEDELPRVRLGQRVTVSLAYDPGRSYAGRVSFIYPEVDPATRTAKLRIEVPNPALELKPEMYANVELEVSYGTQITVPDSAVVDTGEEQVVFLAHEGGYFEPRRVDLGGKVGDRYLVREGVRPGDRIVVSGTFLIDSESRLKSSLAGMSGAAEHAGHAATPKP